MVLVPFSVLISKGDAMSFLFNELASGLFMIVKPVSEVGALPFDCLSVRHKAPNPYLLQRILDGHDVEAILARSAIQAVPASTFQVIPPRSEIRRRWAPHGRRQREGPALRLIS